VIVGASWLISSAFLNTASFRAINEVYAIKHAVGKFYMRNAYPRYTPSLLNPSNPEDLTFELANAGGIFPDTLSYDAGVRAMKNPWGGRVVVIGKSGGKSFTIQYTDVPQDVCIQMVRGASGLDSVQGNHDKIIPNKSPITPDDAVNSICTITTATGNTLNFDSH